MLQRLWARFLRWELHLWRFTPGIRRDPRRVLRYRRGLMHLMAVAVPLALVALVASGLLALRYSGEDRLYALLTLWLDPLWAVLVFLVLAVFFGGALAPTTRLRLGYVVLYPVLFLGLLVGFKLLNSGVVVEVVRLGNAPRADAIWLSPAFLAGVFALQLGSLAFLGWLQRR